MATLRDIFLVDAYLIDPEVLIRRLLLLLSELVKKVV
jgi:hypothetical protein